MKNILTVLLCIISISSFGQASKWFVSLFTGAKVAGPPVTIKHHMKEHGYDETVTSTFLWTTTTNYPVEDVYPSLLVMMGKRISDYKSVYIVAGRSARGVVSGFRTEGYADFFGLFSGPYGQRIDIPYSIYQLGGGVMYSFPNTRTKLAAGPSFFLFEYGGEEYTGIEKHHSFLPGLSGVLRVPFGREKKLVGIDLVVELNLAPPATIKGDEAPLQVIQLQKVNMIHAAVGLALSFRR
jgi:hypothetical protein